MVNRYSDFEEFRPTGEGAHIPDDTLNERWADESWQQRTATARDGYPDKPSDAGAECQSCGASIPSRQTKCRFCLTNHLGDDATRTDDATETTLLGIVLMVVESTTFYGAVAKGGAAAKLLTAKKTESAVDDYTLLYDLDETPAPQLVDRWPSLLAAVEAASAEGKQLLAAAQDRTGWMGHAAAEGHQQAQTRLYDQRGNAIPDESRLTAVLDDADDAVWLVPAIGLSETAGEDQSDRRRSSGPTTQQLDCQNCDQATCHHFETHESIPNEVWTGQPLWECQVCGSVRYGPSLE